MVTGPVRSNADLMDPQHSQHRAATAPPSSGRARPELSRVGQGQESGSARARRMRLEVEEGKRKGKGNRNGDGEGKNERGEMRSEK